jgi:hypothetical protein
MLCFGAFSCDICGEYEIVGDRDGFELVRIVEPGSVFPFGEAGHGVDCWLRNTGAQTYSFLWIFPGFVSIPYIVGFPKARGGVTRPVCLFVSNRWTNLPPSRQLVSMYTTPLFCLSLRYTMEFLQPSMDSSRRTPIRYHIGGGVLILYVGSGMLEPTEGLLGAGANEVCDAHLGNGCPMHGNCPCVHVYRKYGERITGTFNVDCLCTRCLKLTGTARSLLQCMLFCAYARAVYTYPPVPPTIRPADP